MNGRDNPLPVYRGPVKTDTMPVIRQDGIHYPATQDNPIGDFWRDYCERKRTGKLSLVESLDAAMSAGNWHADFGMGPPNPHAPDSNLYLAWEYGYRLHKRTLPRDAGWHYSSAALHRYIRANGGVLVLPYE